MAISCLPTYPLVLFGIIEPALPIWAYIAGIRDPLKFYNDQDARPGVLGRGGGGAAAAAAGPGARPGAPQRCTYLLLLAALSAGLRVRAVTRAWPGEARAVPHHGSRSPTWATRLRHVTPASARDPDPDLCSGPRARWNGMV